MSKTTKIIIGVILTTVLLLGVGYAAIQNISLNITGTAKADVSQSNFIVKFANTTQVSDATKVTASVTNSTNATMNVTGLTAKGDSVTATYTVQNISTDLSAKLSVQATNSNEEYFTIATELGKTTLEAGDANTLTVTITLIKTPITDNITSTIGLQLTSEPVQPGEEGGTEGGSGDDSSGSEGTEPDVTSIQFEDDAVRTYPPDIDDEQTFMVTAITSPNANPTGTFEWEIIGDIATVQPLGNGRAQINVLSCDEALETQFTLSVTYKPLTGQEVVFDKTFEVVSPGGSDHDDLDDGAQEGGDDH